MPVQRLLLFGLAFGYLALTGHPLAPFAGLSLSLPALGLCLALAVWAIALPGAPLRARAAVVLLGGLALAKVALGWAAPGYALVAEYRTGPDEAAVERSTDWRGLGATRVDRHLEWRGDEFPVHFFNDISRFNFYATNDPRRDLLPFSARWTGQFHAPAAGRYGFVLEANGRSSLALPGLRATEGDAPAIESGQRVRRLELFADLEAGLHPIELRYARPPEGMPWLTVLAGRGDGELVPLAAPSIVRAGVDVAALGRDAWVRPAAVLVDVAFVGTLALLFALHMLSMLSPGYSVIPSAARDLRSRPLRRSLAALGMTDKGASCTMATGDVAPSREDNVATLERPLLALFAAGALAWELARHLHLYGRAVILSGGNDWLAYEGFARAVLLEGPLLADGRGWGEGAPFSYQPLYFYWLALVHVVLGEGLFGPLFANAALGVAANLLVYALARELFGRLAAVAALLLFAAYRVTVFEPTTGLLLSENLINVLVPLLLLLLARAARTGSRPAVVGAGIVLGLAVLTRSTPLVLLPLAVPVLLLAYRRLGLSRAAALGRVALFAAACLVAIAPAPLRNYAVSGRAVLTTDNMGVNLRKAHQPTARVDLSRIDRDPLYERLGLDRPAREVAQFVRQDPAGYAATLVPMALYAVGVVGAVEGTSDVHSGLVGMWAAYLLTVALVPAARGLPTWPLHAFVWTHLAAVTVFFSHQYGFRLVLPMYVAMAPIVGAGLATLAGLGVRVWGLGDERRDRNHGDLPNPKPQTLTPVVALCSLLLLAWAFPLDEARAREAFYGLRGDAAIAARQAQQAGHLRAADAVYFVGEDSRSTAVAYLPGLAYPAMRWFDGARAVVFPPRGERGLYVLPERAAADFAGRCLDVDALGTPAQDGPTDARLSVALVGSEDSACGAPSQTVGAPFEGSARLLGYDAPATLEPGQSADVVVHWEALARPSGRARPFARLVDARGRRWGQAEVVGYPSATWWPGEVAAATARLEVEPTLPPGPYRLELGVVVGSEFARLAADGPWGERGQAVARGGELRLVSRSTPLDPAALPIAWRTEADFDGLRLLGGTLEPEAPRPGERARLTLFWQNRGARDRQDATLVLRDDTGRVLDERRWEPLDGVYPVASWKPNEVLRDTRDLVLPADLPSGAVELAVGVAPPDRPPERLVTLTQLDLRPPTRQMTEPRIRARQEATLGELARLVGYDLKNRRVKAGETVELSLVWQAVGALAAAGESRSVIAVRLLGPGEAILAEHAAEPANGRRPLAGWLPGEYVEDGHRLRVPRETSRGSYRLAVAIEREDGGRLPTADGADAVVLATEVVVE